jgi:hypothetical protein
MSANVQTLTALTEFRSALCTFIVEARQALAALEMEARRAVDYITHDQAQAWQSEVRRGREKVQQCKLEIHNTRTFKRIGNYTPSCIDEKKELAKAERRLNIADAKLEAVRHWGRVAEQAFREFQARLAQFISLLDGELPKGVCALDRMLVSLESYLAVQAPQATPELAGEIAEPTASCRETPATEEEKQPDLGTDAAADSHSVNDIPLLPAALGRNGSDQTLAEETP